MERKLELLGRWIEGRERGIRTVIGGDFNAWTREKGGRVGLKRGDEERLERRSRWTEK